MKFLRLQEDPAQGLTNQGKRQYFWTTKGFPFYVGTYFLFRIYVGVLSHQHYKLFMC